MLQKKNKNLENFKVLRMQQASNLFKNIFIILMLFYSPKIMGQNDSSSYWVNAIVESKTIEQAIKTEEIIQGYYARNIHLISMPNIDIILRSAAKSKYAKKVFFELFYCFEGRTKNTKIETEFNLYVISLEHDKDFSNSDVKNQLHYYYGMIYFTLNEYFYSEKNMRLFLKNGHNSFPELVQENHSLNAMTVLSLVELKQNKFSESLRILNETLDSAIVKNNKAWIGITKGNIGNVYYEQGNFEEAIKYLNEDCKTSIETNEIGSALGSFLLLKNIYYKQGDQVLYNIYLDSAYLFYQKIIKENPSNELIHLKEGLDLNNSLAERCFIQKDYTNASSFYKIAYDLSNKIDKKQKERLLKKTIEVIEIDKNINRINELNEEINKNKGILLFSLVFIILIIGLLLVYMSFYGRLKNANKNLKEIKTIISQQNLDLEKINADKDLLFSLISKDLLALAQKQHQIINSMANNTIPITDYDKIVPSLLLNSAALITILEDVSTQQEKTKNFSGLF